MVSVLNLFRGLLFRPVRLDGTDVSQGRGEGIAIPALIAATAGLTTA
jgi:hypothetical protein